MATDDEQRHATEQEAKDADKDARGEMDRLAEADELPSDLSEWPAGKAKFLTLGGSEDPDRYGEGATSNLGPAEVVHHAGGAVSVGGEQVDNPEDFKGEPIPGGPTDPNTPAIAGEGKRANSSGDSGGDSSHDGGDSSHDAGDNDNE
jgi:hypothetical protein